jgi:hypothetical protein
MDAAEFADWCAFAALEPFGSRVEDVRAGTIAAAAAASVGAKTPPGEWIQWVSAEGDRPAAGGWQHIFAAMGAFVAPAAGQQGGG